MTLRDPIVPKQASSSPRSDSAPVLFRTASPVQCCDDGEGETERETARERDRQWRLCFLELRTDAVLALSEAPPETERATKTKRETETDRGTERETERDAELYDASCVSVTHLIRIADSVPSNFVNPLHQQQLQLCLSLSLCGELQKGRKRRLCIVLHEEAKEKLFHALRTVATDKQTHNLDTIRESSISEQSIWSPSQNQSVSQNSNRNQSLRPTYTAMRSSTAMVKDTLHHISRKQQVLDKRGSFKYLPVFFGNDLVHGSWWFVVGSLLWAVSSAVVLENSFNYDMGDDDSFLSNFRYRATWLLMILSALFCTLGSLAFVRAVHSDPPMKPLFSWYHIQSDELLGSWLFLFAVLPLIPYCLIYIAATNDNPIYLLALAIVLLCLLGTYLLVRACYPLPSARKAVIVPLLSMFCQCCCSENWRKHHFANDWLAGTWLVYWGTLFGSVGFGVLLAYTIYTSGPLQIFIMATGFIETVFFLVGSAYFVAGSYPSTSSEFSPDNEL